MKLSSYFEFKDVDYRHIDFILRIFLEKSNFITFFQRGKYSQALPKEYGIWIRIAIRRCENPTRKNLFHKIFLPRCQPLYSWSSNYRDYFRSFIAIILLLLSSIDSFNEISSILSFQIFFRFGVQYESITVTNPEPRAKLNKHRVVTKLRHLLKQLYEVSCFYEGNATFAVT